MPKKVICILLAVLFLTGCMEIIKRTEPKVLDASNNQPVTMAAENLSIGSNIKIYEVPVTINKIPDKPRLLLEFTVLDKGHCPLTYEPTQVLVNSIEIASIDFRDFEYKDRRVIEITIPKSNLKIGENIFQVRTGECQYDIDVMRFNRFQFFQN